MANERRTDEEIINVVNAVIGSWEYNRYNSEMCDIISDLIDRVSGYHLPTHHANTEDVDLIFGVFVMFCGEYGTSPRSGWFGTLEREVILQALNDELDELIRTEGEV